MKVKLEKWMAVIFILPCIVILLVITVFPLIYSLWLSFNSWELAMGFPPEFIGVENYVRLFQEARFWNAMFNIGKVLIFGVGSQLLIGLVLAVVLDKLIRGRTLFTTLFLLPMVIAPVVVGCTWRQIYHYQYGPLNYLLQGVGLPAVTWLSSSKFSLPSIIISDTWEWTPFMMVVILAGLQSIPEELREAAAIDGASSWKVFTHVLFPLLKPVIIVGVLVRVMDTFKLFDLVVLLTQGGPGESSETITYYNYLVGFKHFSLGYAAALSYIQLIVIIIIANFFLRFLREEA